MAVHVSPGVYTKIIDLSEYVRMLPSTIGCVPIFCEKGPDNELVFTNSQDFFKDFGEPNINYVGKQWGCGPYIAAAYLEQSDALYVTRLLPEDATFANLIVTLDTSDATSVFVAVSESPTPHQTVASMNSYVNSSTYSNILMAFYGIGRGEYYNDLKLSIVKPDNDYTWKEKHMYNFLIWKKTSTMTGDTAGSGTYTYEISESFMASIDDTVLDDSGESAWVEHVINRNSKLVRVIASASKFAELLATYRGQEYFDISDHFYTLKPTGAVTVTNGVVSKANVLDSDETNAVSFAGGSSGSLFDPVTGNIETTEAMSLVMKFLNGVLETNTGEIIVDPDTGAITTGSDPIYLTDVVDKEQVYFSLIFNPGYTYKAINAEFENLCKRRGDCVAIVDNGDNVSLAGALANRTGAGITSGLNNKAVAIYEGYGQMFDMFTSRYVWMTPVYHMAKIIPYNDNVAEIWYAPAGFNRGTIANIEQLRYSPNLDGRDQLYLAQLNPIVRFKDTGDVVFGQLTSQRRPTALQDLNIVRTVLYIQRALEQFCKFYLFELNEEETWGRIAKNVNEFLGVIKAKKGLKSFSVEVGATEYEFKAKQVHVNVILTPMRVIEQIYLNFFIK